MLTNKQLYQIRNNVWYHRWEELYDFMKSIGIKHEEIKKILEQTYCTFDNARAFKYKTVSYSGYRSLQQLIEDKNNVQKK